MLLMLVGCLGLNDPLRQYFSLYRPVSQREDKKEMIDEGKNVQTTPPAPTASTEGPCLTLIQISRTHRHWKLVGCFRLKGPLRKYLSPYRAVSPREGE